MCICQIGVLHVARLGIEDRLCHIILSLSPPSKSKTPSHQVLIRTFPNTRELLTKYCYHLHEKKHITVKQIQNLVKGPAGPETGTSSSNGLLSESSSCLYKSR